MFDDMGTKGLAALVTPHSKSEFQAMAEAARAHHHAMHDQLHTIAAELRRDLGRLQGTGGLLGLDVKIAAYRVTRHLVRAGQMEFEVAKAIVRSYYQFEELFLNKSPAAQPFDLDK